MGQYDRLDRLILERLAGDSDGMRLIFLNAGEVRQESERLEKDTGREAFRVLDGRLQALRKKGAISYDSKKGWQGWRDAVKTPNVELTGAARVYRAASSDRRERG